ncbi:MAG: universal stress protein [Thaumarchaeota archaeon]|nr:universal stress protein [Nitrososphaerota archaeon]
MTRFGAVLVSIDGSEDAKKATEAAIAIAKRFGSELFILHVIPRISYHSEKLQREFVKITKRHAEEWIENALAQAKGEGLKVRGEIVSNVPSIVEAIVDYASEWKVDLIVVGTRGLSGLKRAFLGSISSGLVTQAPCNVLIVK